MSEAPTPLERVVRGVATLLTLLLWPVAAVALTFKRLRSAVQGPSSLPETVEIPDYDPERDMVLYQVLSGVAKCATWTVTINRGRRPTEVYHRFNEQPVWRDVHDKAAPASAARECEACVVGHIAAKEGMLKPKTLSVSSLDAMYFVKWVEKVQGLGNIDSGGPCDRVYMAMRKYAGTEDFLAKLNAPPVRETWKS